MRSAESVVHSLVLPRDEGGDLLKFSRQEAGWDWMSLTVKRVLAGQAAELTADGEEVAMVLLSGNCTLDWGHGEVPIHGRTNVFDGFPHAFYLPHGNRLRLKADTECEFAECRVPSIARLKPRLITPEDVSSTLRGGENSSRQVVDLIMPDFPADKLMVVEVYTPGGNWSSYPPHKHDENNPPAEVVLDEIYYYRLKEAQGYALQNLYTPSKAKNSVLKVHDGDAVLVREGYHPVVAGPGYDTYYLNFLAGSSRAMAVTEDPDHQWLRSTWKQPDPRLPLVGR